LKTGVEAVKSGHVERLSDDPLGADVWHRVSRPERMHREIVGISHIFLGHRDWNFFQFVRRLDANQTNWFDLDFFDQFSFPRT